MFIAGSEVGPNGPQGIFGNDTLQNVVPITIESNSRSFGRITSILFARLFHV